MRGSLACFLLKHRTNPSPFTHNSLTKRSLSNVPQEVAADENQKKRLDVAIIGLPNAGKSQLLNTMTQSTISAVSKKRHTTVQGVLGGLTRDNTQLLFVDTPGFLRQGDTINRHHVQSQPQSEIKFVDHTLVVVDAARNLTDDVKGSLADLFLLAMESEGRMETIEGEEAHSDFQSKFSVVLTKTDLVYPKSEVLETAMEIGEIADTCVYQYAREFEKRDIVPDEELPIYFYLSPLKKPDGVKDLIDFLMSKATPANEWELDQDDATTLSPEERVEEVVREKLYRFLHQELPYEIRQTNRLFRVVKRQDESLVVEAHQDLVVRTKSHKEMICGRGNRTLEHIRSAAVRDLEVIFGCPVELLLHVKHSKSRNWTI